MSQSQCQMRNILQFFLIPTSSTRQNKQTNKKTKPKTQIAWKKNHSQG